MTIRIEPRPRTRRQLDEAPGKIVTTLLSVAAAGLVEPGRFRRGREYQLEGAVSELAVDPGVVRAIVQGSRRTPYEVLISTTFVPPVGDGTPLDRHRLAALTPDADDLHLTCTCPDGDAPCKHAAAALLAFAAEAGDRPELLSNWRCGEPKGRARAVVGSRAGGPAAARHLPAAAAAASPFASPAWQEFFGAGLPDPGEPIPFEPFGIGAEHLGPFDVSAMIRSAQHAMTLAGRDH